MGWFYDDGGHEGYPVGFVELRPGAGLLRELHVDDQDRAREAGGRLALRAIAAGCDCGWRSPRWTPLPSSVWVACSVLPADTDEDRALLLWEEHMRHVAAVGLAGRLRRETVRRAARGADR